MEHETHPSFFALDRFASSTVVDAALEQHVAACERCHAHVQALRAPLTVPLAIAERCLLPARARGLRGFLAWANAIFEDGLHRDGLRGWFVSATGGARRGAFALLSAAALGVAMLLVTRGLRAPAPSAELTPYIASRGSAAVGLYVKRGEQVFLWDGRQRVQAGDLLRLKVLPEGFTQVGVFTQDTPLAAPALLHVMQLGRSKEVLLPSAWKVDPAPHAETLIVVLANGLKVSELQAHAANPRPPANVWVRRLTLDKAPLAEPLKAPDRSTAPKER